MSLDVEKVDPQRNSAWDEIVSAAPDACVFHSSAWARVLAESYGFRPCYLIVHRDGQWLAALPVMEVTGWWRDRKGVSLPFTDYCPPLFAPGVNGEEIVQCLIDWGKGQTWKSLEVRGAIPGFVPDSASAEYVEHSLPLSCDCEQWESAFRSSTRRNLKKAYRQTELTIHQSTSFEAMREYFRLHCLTRKHHGIPPQPFAFFRAIHEFVLARGLGQVFLASYQGRWISGAVYFQWGHKAIYKFGASDRRSLDLRANYRIMGEALRWYARSGYQSFSFGRTDLEDQGLCQFKSGWGAQEHPLHYYRYDYTSGGFAGGHAPGLGFSRKVFRKMPVPVLRTIGTLLYKHAG